MSIQDKATLNTQISTLLADNVSGDISEGDMRTVTGDNVDSNMNLAETGAQVMAGPIDMGGNAITNTDIDFSNISGLPSSIGLASRAYVHEEDNTAVTTIGASYVIPVISTTDPFLVDFTSDGAGVLTYTGSETKEFQMEANTSHLRDSGSQDRSVEFAWHKNGSIELPGKQAATAQAAVTGAPATVVSVVSLATGNTIELRVRGVGSLADIQVTNLTYRVNIWR